MVIQQPILGDKLTIPEQVTLASMTHHPGFKILVKMFEAACEDATQEVLRVDPEEQNYERVLAARQQCSRSTHQFSRRVLDSIQYHIQVARNKGAEVDPEVQGN